MNYDEYNTEYQKVILKEQLKRGLKIKTTLMDTLKTTDNKQYLEFFLQATDSEGYLANNEQALEDLGQDKEQDKDKDKNKDKEADQNMPQCDDDKNVS